MAANNTNNINNSLAEFWDFVERLNFDSNQKSAETIRQTLLKQLPPHVAENYKDVCDSLAYTLYRGMTDKNMPAYLYASYEAIARGRQYYHDCTKNSSMVESLSEKIQPLNHFGNCFPTEDDYYAANVQANKYYVDDFDNYID